MNEYMNIMTQFLKSIYAKKYKPETAKLEE